MSDTSDFYQNLPFLADFQTLHDERHYHKLPNDWFVVVTDIQGSTKAIESGRYRDVNTLGAAAIAVVQSALLGKETPSVFGGDGASFLVPPEDLPVIKEALLGLKALSYSQYGLVLRVGGIQVSEIRWEGFDVEIAKFNLGDGKMIPLLRGGGMSLADDKIKAFESSYEWSGDSTVIPQLGALSCRWKPLPSARGKILTLLVKANSHSYIVYEQVLSELVRILGDNWNQSSPVRQSSMHYKSLKKILQDELRLQKIWPIGQWLKRVLSIVITVLTFGWKLPMPFDTKTYLEQTQTHSDFRKFDDMLRLVLDCSKVEIEQIQAMLESLYQSGTLYYGTHVSDHALMTCLVESMNAGGHIHFIDGSDGGYAMAAVGLKAQIK